MGGGFLAPARPREGGAGVEAFPPPAFAIGSASPAFSIDEPSGSRRSHAARILHRRVPSTQSSTKYASPLTVRETTRTGGPAAPAAVVVRACTPSTFSVVFQPAGRQSFTPVTALS